MRKYRSMLRLVPIVSLVFLFCSCASSGDASGYENKLITGQNHSNINSEKTASEPILSGVSSAKTVTYDFEDSLNSWKVSTWENEIHGELAFTKALISTNQKSSGTSSVALACDFKGVLSNSRYAQGVFKIDLDQPVNLKGKTLSANIYIPEELVAPQFKASSYGFKIFIKTGIDYTWSDGGFNDIANDLKAGWNQITFSPVGVNESQTYELGIQMTKGDTSADWSGTIYIDEISY